MKTRYGKALISAIIGNLYLFHFSFAFTFQDTTRQRADTLYFNKAVISTSYFSAAKVKENGHSLVIADDPKNFQFSSGVNVINSLRGHVPGVIMGPDVFSPSDGIRSAQSHYIIDGVVHNPAIKNYYNLNAFEYQRISILQSSNALISFGNLNPGGAFLLESKTGENSLRPSFEFNSYSTFLRYKVSGLQGNNSTLNQSVFTNALAYMQDFGKIDTRISYSFTSFPETDIPYSRKSRQHFFKINTGFDLTSKFKIRFIADKLYRNSSSDLPNPFPVVSPAKAGYDDNNFQTNLILTYQILRWLKISSQGVYSKTGAETEAAVYNHHEKEKQKRYYGNVILSADKKLSDHFSFTAFAGFQIDKIKRNRSLRAQSMWSESERSYKTNAFITGLGAKFNDFLFADFNYRINRESHFSPADNTFKNYSVSGSFVFSEALGWTSSVFTLGKLRASIGKSDKVGQQPYPYVSTADFLFPFPHSETKISELGADLSFIENRIYTSPSFFKNRILDNYLFVSSMPPIGYPQIINLGEIETSGWQILVGGQIIRNKNTVWETKLTWTNPITEIKSAVSNSGNNGVLGSPMPDWVGSVLNQIQWKNLFVSILIDSRKGGDYYSYDFTNPSFPGFRMQDGTQAKLRDISVGYALSSNFLSHVLIKEAVLSVSGRNLWLIYSKADDDVESYAQSGFGSPGGVSKSASISLTVKF